MDSKKPVILNDLEEWDFTGYIDSLIQKVTISNRYDHKPHRLG